MNNDSRVDQAVQSIDDAMVALSRAIYLLGLSEGKEIVQHAHGVVAEFRRLQHQHGMAPPGPGITRTGNEAGWASSPVAARVLAALDMGSTNVIDLMAALQRSIAEDDEAKPGPAPQPEKSKLTKAVAPKRGR
jgi:hypothetical protein